MRPRFITLTEDDGAKLFVNVDAIVLVILDGSVTTIRFVAGNAKAVRESFQQVIAAIELA